LKYFPLKFDSLEYLIFEYPKLFFLFLQYEFLVVEDEY